MYIKRNIKRSSFGVVLVFSDKFTADKLIF